MNYDKSAGTESIKSQKISVTDALFALDRKGEIDLSGEQVTILEQELDRIFLLPENRKNTKTWQRGSEMVLNMANKCNVVSRAINVAEEVAKDESVSIRSYKGADEGIVKALQLLTNERFDESKISLLGDYIIRKYELLRSNLESAQIKNLFPDLSELANDFQVTPGSKVDQIETYFSIDSGAHVAASIDAFVKRRLIIQNGLILAGDEYMRKFITKIRNKNISETQYKEYITSIGNASPELLYFFLRLIDKRITNWSATL